MKNMFRKNGIFLRVLYESFLKNTIESGLVVLKHQSLSILDGLVQGFCAFQRVGFLQSVLVGMTALSVVFSVLFSAVLILSSYEIILLNPQYLILSKAAVMVSVGLLIMSCLLFYALTSPVFVSRAVGAKRVEEYFDRITQGDQQSPATEKSDRTTPDEPVWAALLQELTPVVTSVLIEWIRHRDTTRSHMAAGESVDINENTIKSVWLSDQEIAEYQSPKPPQPFASSRMRSSPRHAA